MALWWGGWRRVGEVALWSGRWSGADEDAQRWRPPGGIWVAPSTRGKPAEIAYHCVPNHPVSTAYHSVPKYLVSVACEVGEVALWSGGRSGFGEEAQWWRTPGGLCAA